MQDFQVSNSRLIKSSAQFSRSSPLARPGVLVPATAKTINPAPVRLPLTDAIPHPRLRPYPHLHFIQFSCIITKYKITRQTGDVSGA